MKSIETKIAEQNVDASIANFENAVGHLVNKVESTANTVTRRIETARERIRLPARAVRRVSGRVRSNPVPYIWGAFYAAGLYLCYRIVAGIQQRPQVIDTSGHAWSQQEP